MSKTYQQEKMNKILLLPVALMIILVPLFVRMSIVIPSEAVEKVFMKTPIIDFFAQGKATVLMIISGIMLIMFFFFFDKTKIKKSKPILFYAICAGVFLFFSILSTIFAEHRDVALWGVPDRAEGLVVYLCYLFIMFYMMYAFNTQADYRYIIIPLMIITAILTVIGVLQWMGKDFMIHTDLGLKLIVPEKYAQLRTQVGATMKSKTAYGTFSNPNYIGSYIALVFPIFMTLALFLKDWKKQIVFAILSLCSLFLLGASGSRAGMIGCSIALVIAGMVFIKVIIKKWMITVPLILIAIISLFGLNHANGGKLFNQANRIIQDITKFIQADSEIKSYKDDFPVKALEAKDGMIVFSTEDDKLILKLIDQNIRFYDNIDNEIDYEEKKGIYKTTDKRFNKIVFEKIVTSQEHEALWGLEVYILGRKSVLIKIDSETGLYPIHPYTQEKTELREAPWIGFEGKEMLGSNRGYIWSRSMAVFLESLFVGKGVDTFVLHFPQDDYLAKAYIFGNRDMVVDKPHNTYLQIGINHGGVALLAYLLLVGTYILHSVKLYAFKSSYTHIEVMGIATTLGIVGYLMSGIFNDSVVGIAFIAWLLLGVGITLNHLVSTKQEGVNLV